MITFLVVGILICLGYCAISYINEEMATHRNEAKRAEAFRLEQETAARNLTGKKVVVAIRQRDGKRTCLESLAIQGLLDKGANVISIPIQSANELAAGKQENIPEGCLAVVGTGWEEDGTTKCYLDIRIIHADGRILASDYWNDCIALVPITCIPFLAAKMKP